MRARRWPSAVAAALLAFVVFTGLALGFDVNGSQYDGWVRTFGILAIAAIPFAIAAVVFHPRSTRRRVIIALIGLATAAAALAITVLRYGDPYSGSSTWPVILAWIGLAGLLASAAALCLPAARRHG